MARNTRASPGIIVHAISSRIASSKKRNVNEFRRIEINAYPTNVRTVMITSSAMSWN